MQGRVLSGRLLDSAMHRITSISVDTAWSATICTNTKRRQKWVILCKSHQGIRIDAISIKRQMRPETVVQSEHGDSSMNVEYELKKH